MGFKKILFGEKMPDKEQKDMQQNNLRLKQILEQEDKKKKKQKHKK